MSIKRWYIVDGESPVPDERVRGVVIVEAKSYNSAIKAFEKDFPSFYCINADVFTKETAKSYNVFWGKTERAIKFTESTSTVITMLGAMNDVV